MSNAQFMMPFQRLFASAANDNYSIIAYYKYKNQELLAKSTVFSMF